MVIFSFWPVPLVSSVKDESEQQVHHRSVYLLFTEICSKQEI